MRPGKILAAFSIVLFTSVMANATNQPFEKDWKGYAVQTNGLQAGYLMVYYDLYNMQFNPETNQLSGMKKISITYKDLTYHSTCMFTGTFYPVNNQVVLKMGSIVSEVPLPDNMTWQHNDMELDFFADTELKNVYIMEGYTIDENGEKSLNVQFTNGDELKF